MKNYLFTMELDGNIKLDENFESFTDACAQLLYAYNNDKQEQILFLKSCQNLDDKEIIKLLNKFLYNNIVEDVYELGEKIY